jgi:hypothetical protein
LIKNCKKHKQRMKTCKTCIAKNTVEKKTKIDKNDKPHTRAVVRRALWAATATALRVEQGAGAKRQGEGARPRATAQQSAPTPAGESRIKP